MKFNFSVSEHIKKSWPLYSKNFGAMVLFGLVYFVAQYMMQKEGSFVVLMLAIVASLVLSYTWIKSLLALIGGHEFRPFSKTMLPRLPELWNYAKTMILTSFFTLVGLILLVIPGIYVAGRLVFAPYIAVSKGYGARKSVRESWDMTREYGWVLVWKTILIGLFGFVGIIALFVGILFTGPMSYIVKAMLYKEFAKFSDKENTDINTSGGVDAKKKVVAKEEVVEVTAEKVS